VINNLMLTAKMCLLMIIME